MSRHQKNHHETAAEDRLPLKEKIAFALGNLGPAGIVVTLKDFIFVMEMGIPPAVLGTINLIVSTIYGLTTPLLGQFADNFRSRWGRRKPLMLLGGIPMVIITCATYAFPSGLSEQWIRLWILMIPLLCLIPGSFYQQGLAGLQTEAVRDYHERLRLAVFSSFAVTVFGLTNQWLYPFIKGSIPPLSIHIGDLNMVLKFPVFADALTGARWVVGGFGVFFVVCVLMPLFLCPERRYEQVKKSSPKSPFLPALKEAFKNREFLIMFSIKTVTFFCYSIVQSLGLYMNTYLVYGGDKKAAAVTYAMLGSSYIISATASLAVYRMIEPKLGKHNVTRIAAGILMLGCISKLFVYRPDMPWLQLIPLIANGAATTGLHLMSSSMFGDIIDYDELLHHKRREALFGSLYNWGEVKGVALAGCVGGFMLLWIGFNTKIVGTQNPTTLHMMQFFYFLFPFLGALFAYVMIGHYTLTEARMYEIRDELKRRHAKKKAEEEAQALQNND